jgi:hypothetical protein
MNNNSHIGITVWEFELKVLIGGGFIVQKIQKTVPLTICLTVSPNPVFFDKSPTQ